jgi:hypothetical protein
MVLSEGITQWRAQLYRPCAHVARRIAIHRPDLADRATWNRFTTSEGDEKLSAAPGCLSPPGLGTALLTTSRTSVSLGFLLLL